MALKTKPELKEYYKAGSRASESQWYDLIDSLFNILDDGDELLPHEYENVLYVDAASAVTGVVGDISQPYNNPNLAQADANAGDLIIIFPGEYDVDNLFKAGITYYALPGVQLTNVAPGIMEPPAFFTDWAPHTPGVCTLKGYADMIDDDYFIHISQSGTTINIECNSITRGTATQPAVIGDNDSSVNIRVKRIHDDGTQPFVVANVNTNIKAEEVGIFNITRTNPFVAVNGDGSDRVFSFEFTEVDATAYSAIASSTVFSISGSADDSGTYTVRNTNVVTSAGALLTANDNRTEVLIDNVRFVTSNQTTTFGLVNMPASGTGTQSINIKNSELILDTTDVGQEVVKGSNDLKVIGTLNTNINKDTNSTILIGELNIDTDLKV